MNVSELMTTDVRSCGPNDNLQRAAQIMWEGDCGVVPVVDAKGCVVGMLTDRDICMAAFTQGRPLHQILVSRAMAKSVYSVREDDLLTAAEALMRQVRVRRLPVIDQDLKLKGMLTMNDFARHHAQRLGGHTNGSLRSDSLVSDSIVQTMAAICQRREVTQGQHSTARSPIDASPSCSVAHD